MSLRSMTGFGEGQASDDRVGVRVTMRSVNHRGFDLVLRLREELRPLEAALRRRIGERVARGRVEVTIEFESTDASLRALVVDHAAVAAVVAAAQELQSRYGLREGLTVSDVLRLPDVLVAPARAQAADLAAAVAVAALERALDTFDQSREREGAGLEVVLLSLAADLRARVATLRHLAPAARQVLAEAFTLRIAEAVGEAGVDLQRLAQEVALLADRADVREELDRLQVHLDALDQALGSCAAVGKRLDVLLQEIQRELSTLAAKSRDSASKAEVIEARLLAEQLREQVANVE